MSDQIINVNHSGNDDKTFSKEEICEICNLSKSTLNKWLLEEKADENDYKTAKMGKKLYYFSYIKRVFKTALREDLIDILIGSQEIDKGQPKDNPKATQSIPNSDFSQLLTQQTEIIKILQDQLSTKDDQIKSLNQSLENAQKIVFHQQNISLQQGKMLLESKKKKRGGLFGLFGGNNQREEEKGVGEV